MHGPSMLKISPMSRLIDRLDAIGHSLERRGDAQALLGLGSVGRETDRLDEHSDLDFFVIVDPGAKASYLEALDWLSDVHALVFSFQNTRDGHKALFADDIFCEFAIFEPHELGAIPYAPGRLVWKRHDAPDSYAEPSLPLPSPQHDVAWLLGEALSNLYIGLKRHRRGESLAALRLIQGYAVDHLLELVDLRWPASHAARDPFAVVRRVEARHPERVADIARWTQGYAHNDTSALAMLDFLEEHFDVPAAMADAIRAI